MAGLPKWIIAKYGMTKRAWQVFRSGAKKNGGGKTTKRKRKKKTRTATGETHKEGATKMAKKRRSIRRAARRAGRHARQAMGMGSRPGAIMTMAAMAAAGGVGTSLLVNKAPVIKDQARGTKAAVQFGIGVAAVMFARNRTIKGLGAGAVISGVLSAVKAFTNIDPLAGPSAGGRTLSPSAMQSITGGMGIPLPQNGRMGVPLQDAPVGAGFPRAGFGS